MCVCEYFVCVFEGVRVCVHSMIGSFVIVFMFFMLLVCLLLLLILRFSKFKTIHYNRRDVANPVLKVPLSPNQCPLWSCYK